MTEIRLLKFATVKDAQDFCEREKSREGLPKPPDYVGRNVAAKIARGELPADFGTTYRMRPDPVDEYVLRLEDDALDKDEALRDVEPIIATVDVATGTVTRLDPGEPIPSTRNPAAPVLGDADEVTRR